jgi:hypothetical protein
MSARLATWAKYTIAYRTISPDGLRHSRLRCGQGMSNTGIVVVSRRVIALVSKMEAAKEHLPIGGIVSCSL